MKLETSIKLRLDGTVRFKGFDNKDYIFTPDRDTGLVVCDVDHEETLTHLLRFGSFFPVDEADHERAAALVETARPNAVVESPEDEPDDDVSDPNALPLEADTPPAPRRKKTKAE